MFRDGDMIYTERLSKIFFVFSMAVYFFTIVYLFFPYSKCIKEPAVKYDYGYYYSMALNSTKYLKSSFRLWGYNPFFEAGELEGNAFSAKIIIPFNLLFDRIIASPVIYNAAVMILLLVIPLLLGMCARVLKFPSSVQCYSVVLCAFFLLGTDIGKEFVRIGHFGFLSSMMFCCCAGAFLWRYCEDKRKLSLCGHLLFSSLALWSHLLAPFVMTPLCASILVCQRKKLSRIDYLILFLGSLVFVILTNALWIIDFVHYMIKRYQHSSFSQFLQSSLLENLKNFGNLSFLLLVVGYFIWVPMKKTIFKVTIVPVVFLLLISVLGSQMGLGDLQPTRFLIPLAFILIISILASNMKWAWGMAMIFSVNVMFTASKTTLPPIGCGLTANANDFISFMKDNLSPRHRIHIQDSRHLKYFDSRFVQIISSLTGLSTLATRFPFPPTFVQFIEDRLFNRRLAEFSFEHLRNYIELYNIGYFLVFDKGAKDYFACNPDFEEIYQQGDKSLFGLKKSQFSFCYRCQANVSFDLDKVEVSAAKDPVTTLSLHYFPHMEVIPADLVLRPVFLLDDPTPFIQVVNNRITDFTIRMTKPFY